MSYDADQVGRYGKLVETFAERRYPLVLDYPTVGGKRFDLTDDDSNPWDAKGSMLNGVRPTFKFWKDSHDVLEQQGGGYVLVWYRANGREIEVVDSRTIRARDLRITNWTNPGETHHRSETKEAQIPAAELRR